MYAASSDFKAAVRQSHKSIVKAEVWQNESKLLTLDPLDGNVDIDARRTVRRTCTLTVAAPDPTIVLNRQGGNYLELTSLYSDYADMAAQVASYGQLALVGGEIIEESVDAGIVPDDAYDPLAPFGNELRLWRGIEVIREIGKTYADISGSTYSVLDSTYDTYGTLAQGVELEITDEYVPLGVFLITDVEVREGNNGTTVTVQGSDRSLRISRNRWTQPYAVANGTNAATAISEILSDRWDDVPIDFTATTETVKKSVFGLESDNDPWRDAQKIAEAAGLELYFDGDGVARLDTAADYTNATPDETYLEDDDAMVLGVNRALTNTQTFNGVIATGEGTEVGDTFRGEAWDEDPESPTYRYGPFGQYPRFYSSPLLGSNEQCETAAQTILARSKGVVESVDWTQIVDPTLDVGDVIALTNANTKVDRLLVIDRLTVPLSPATPMSAVARTIRSLGGTGFADE